VTILQGSSSSGSGGFHLLLASATIQPSVVFAFFVGMALVSTGSRVELFRSTALVQVDQQMSARITKRQGNLVGLERGNVLLSPGFGLRVIAVMISSHDVVVGVGVGVGVGDDERVCVWWNKKLKKVVQVEVDSSKQQP
jgi:hypothetical protein